MGARWVENEGHFTKGGLSEAQESTLRNSQKAIEAYMEANNNCCPIETQTGVYVGK